MQSILKKIIKKILVKLSLLPTEAQNSWEVYKDYVKIHPTAIIDPAATIKIFNPPTLRSD